MVYSNQVPEENYKKKIFTCGEVEGRQSLRLGSLNENLKHVADDPAIVLFSIPNNLTRYDKVDLYKYKDAKIAQQPPRCYYDPNIMKLNILKYKNQHTNEIEEQMKIFRDKLQNLSFSNWDPNLLILLKNYHNALLNPFLATSYAGNYQSQQVSQPVFNNSYNQSDPQQYQSPRRVSFVDKQQTSVLDKIPSYDRNMNFFDNITTTATMRPPRMGINSYNNNQKRPNYARKTNSCDNEHANSYNSSLGYFSGNETKSSYEESFMEKSCERRMSAFDQINLAKKMEMNGKPPVNKQHEEEEKEPEWFSVPASLNDFVELHGFDDDTETKKNGQKSPSGVEETKLKNDENPIKNMISNFNNDYQNRRNSFNSSYNRYNQNASFNGYSNIHNSSVNNNFNRNNMNNSYRPSQPVNNANQRFRNPLHFNKPARPQVPPLINPIFDAWRNGKLLNKQHVSFTELMAQQQQTYPKTLPSNALYMNEVENRMKQQQSLNAVNQIAPPAAVPQFFQNLATNWGVRVTNDIPQAGMHNTMPNNMNGYQSPTQEQLQQFTSEIMRNAMLRKNQQYHDENNHQK